MFLFFIIAAIALTDRLTKTLALLKPVAAISIVTGVLDFAPEVNSVGPLGIAISPFLFFSLAAFLGAGLVFFIWTETNGVNRALLGGSLLGIVSNVYDRFRFQHIVDTFRLLGGLSFNLADFLIVIGVAGVIIRCSWPTIREEQKLNTEHRT